jgi:hypothetical protein
MLHNELWVIDELNSIHLMEDEFVVVELGSQLLTWCIIWLDS